MGLKVIKISDEGYAKIARVASEQKTYLSDALDLVVFGKVDNEGRRVDSTDGKPGPTPSKARKRKQKTPAERGGYIGKDGKFHKWAGGIEGLTDENGIFEES